MERTFSYAGRQITIRSPRVRDQLAAQILLDLMRRSDVPTLYEIYELQQYANFVLSIVRVEGDDLPFIVRPDADIETLRAGLEAWLNDDSEPNIWELWRYHMGLARTPANDPDLRPDPGEKKDEAAPAPTAD